MESRWSEEGAREAVAKWADAPGCNEDIALRTYTSRLIGADPALVLHGGGNTSVKTTLADDTGAPTRVLCVKGSGWDLGSIEPAGLPAVRLESLAGLRAADTLSDEAMVNAARTRLLDASAPTPSVETLLHAFLPHTFIDHSHADAILTLVDRPGAAAECAELYGNRLALVPYVMPGFALAKLAAEVYEAHPECEGLLLLKHGLFTFGATAREAYERHIDAISTAEAFMQQRRRSSPTLAAPRAAPAAGWTTLAPILRGRLGQGTTRSVMTLRQSREISEFTAHPQLLDRVGRGPMTPDHVIRTKPWPMVLDLEALPTDAWPTHVETALAEFHGRYAAYFDKHNAADDVSRTMLDPDPRVVLVPGLGMIGIGANLGAASQAADLYAHTMTVIANAEAIGGYEPLPAHDLFDMEYWSLEQAKLGKRTPPVLAGHVIAVTGAASGIGAAVVERFAAAGAHVFAMDRDHRVLDNHGSAELADVVDVRDRAAVHASLARCVAEFGGLDGVVSNAGTAPQAAMADCPPEVLTDSLAVNLLSHQWLAEAATGVMRAQGRGGWLGFNASKAAFNPGVGFGPYAVAKAGLVALMKQYALEGAPDAIRSNAVNADRVRTQLLDADDVEARAAARGLSADDYFRANLLRKEVSTGDVADAFFSLAMAKSTTGAVVPVDGGNIAAAPR